MKVGTVVKMKRGLEVQVSKWDCERSDWFEGIVVKPGNTAWNLGVRLLDWAKSDVEVSAQILEGKLKVFLKAVGNTVIFKVLEQDESLRGKNNEPSLYFKTSADTADNLVVTSSIHPNISVNAIYLQGFDRKRDSDVASLQLKTDQEAREFVVKAKAALVEFAANNYFEGRTLETPVVDAGIFWV
jgi:hypothetical protein